MTTKGKFEGALPLQKNSFPLPRWGRGIKGDGVGKNLKLNY